MRLANCPQRAPLPGPRQTDARSPRLYHQAVRSPQLPGRSLALTVEHALRRHSPAVPAQCDRRLCLTPTAQPAPQFPISLRRRRLPWQTAPTPQRTPTPKACPSTPRGATALPLPVHRVATWCVMRAPPPPPVQKPANVSSAARACCVQQPASRTAPAHQVRLYLRLNRAHYLAAALRSTPSVPAVDNHVPRRPDRYQDRGRCRHPHRRHDWCRHRTVRE